MRSWLRTLLGLVFVFGLSEPGQAATEIATMQPTEIEALQKRLTDDGCYTGPIDSQASPATADAVKACPDQDPVLRIETGMHVAAIAHIGVDSACRLMVTGSEDKTLRLWSMPDGRLLRTIRLPISAGNGGKIDAAALSPDGRIIAAGGSDAADNSGKGHGLYLIDEQNGTVKRIGGFDSIINNIAFSTDGKRIGVSLGGSQGIRVLESATGRELMADRDYRDAAFGIAFASDGAFFATSYDGFVRRYGPSLQREMKINLKGGQRPFSIVVSNISHQIAVAYDDTTEISILNSVTLRTVSAVDTKDLSGRNLPLVAWYSDGKRLAFAGDVQFSFGDNPTYGIGRSNLGVRSSIDWVETGPSLAVDLKSCGSSFAFADAGPGLAVMSAGGKLRRVQSPVTFDMHDWLGGSFTVSADTMRVSFKLGAGDSNHVVFDLLGSTLLDAPIRSPDLHAPDSDDGHVMVGWLDSLHPRVDGHDILLWDHERSHALAIRADRASFVLGSDQSLRSFGKEGVQRWNRSVPGPAYAVNVSADGKVIVAAYGDGTIRWHRWSDGQELLALFVNAKDRRWVAWTPTGYYMASPGGEDMIGWHVNRGWEQQADFFPASRFRDKFNRPDIVQAVLSTLDEIEAVKQADAAAGRHEDHKAIIERLPPVINILSPAEGSTVASGMVEIRYQTRMPLGGTIDRVEAFVDGAKIEARGLGPTADAPLNAGSGGAVTLPMPAHDAEISLVAYAHGSASDAARIQLKAAAAADPTSIKPTLYALLVGVSHYEDADLNLGYAAKDASDLADALKTQSGRLYADVQVKVLTDSAATSVALKDGLAWLAAHATDRDLELLFLAGHGITDAKGKFWFLTYDADPARVSSTAVSRDDITGVLYDLPGKKLLFLDACHSGAALEQAGARGLDRSGADLNKALSDFSQAEGGVVAYAASTGRESSYEQEEWGHGAFTKALLEGIGGKADLLHNKLSQPQRSMRSWRTGSRNSPTGASIRS